MPDATYWTIYKIFYPPPGKQGLKCINCRYATAGAATVVGFGGAYGVYRTMMGNVYKGMGFVFLALAGFGTATVALKLAQHDSEWNEKKIQETMKKLDQERSEFKAKNHLAS